MHQKSDLSVIYSFLFDEGVDESFIQKSLRDFVIEIL